MVTITLADAVKEMEFTLARHKAVLEKFADAKISAYGNYSSRLVNKCYTNYTFESEYGGLYVLPFYEVEFVHAGQQHFAKVSSQPIRNRLAYIHYNYSRSDEKKTMKFARFAINQKNHNFKEDMLNACKAEIMMFIKNNPNCKIDDKHLEPRLKKLMCFT